MELVYIALPVALLIGGVALGAFIWAARDDQFEDLDTPPRRAIFDDVAVKPDRPTVNGAHSSREPLDTRQS